MTQAPTPGPLSGDDVKLLVKGDWLLPTLSGASPKQFDHVGSTLRGTPLLFFVDGGSCLASVANFIGRHDVDGWIPWSGGENPVPGQRVETRLRNGRPAFTEASDGLSWSHDTNRTWADHHIIAFRLAPPAPVEDVSRKSPETNTSAEHVKETAENEHVTAPVEASGSERGQAGAVMDALWPLLGGNHTSAELWTEIDAAVSEALRPQPSGEVREADRAFAAKYPLHAELKARETERQTVANFLDWLDEQGLTICHDVSTRRAEYCDYQPDFVTKPNRIGAFMEIDPQRLDDEKRAMLDEIREGAAK